MRKPGIWGLGFRRQGIIRVADVIDDAGTTTGIVVHVAGNNTLFNQIVHIAPHGDNGQPDMAGNVITGMSLLGGVTEVAFNEGKGLALQPFGHGRGAAGSRGGDMEQGGIQFGLGEFSAVDGIAALAEGFQGQLKPLISKGFN